MGLLSTLVKYGEYLPETFIGHFLNIRCMFIPFLAKKTVIKNPEPLQEYLERYTELTDDPDQFMEYDWELQRLMATMTGNPLYRMILNDFNDLYRNIGVEYFKFENARLSSLKYYEKLIYAVRKRDAGSVESIVRDVMDEAIELWSALSGLEENNKKNIN